MWDGRSVCVVGVALACHFTGLYLVLIVTLLVSMGIFRASQVGKGVWKGHRHCQVSGSACAPGRPGKSSPAMGHILSQGKSCEIMGGAVCAALSYYGVYFSQSHYQESRLAEASSHQYGVSPGIGRSTKV